MVKLKKKAREKAAKLQKVILDLLFPLFNKCSERFQLRRKIRIANIWAKRHPKKLLVYYLLFAVCLLATSIIFDFTSTRIKEDSLDLKSLPVMKHRLQSIDNTETMHEKIRTEVSELGQKGIELCHELDSLINLPNKSRSDSLKIISTYTILNNTFNKNEK